MLPRQKNFTIIFMLLIALFTIPRIGIAQPTYHETGGLVVMEAEDLDVVEDWNIRTSYAGYSGSGFIQWEGIEHTGSDVGHGTITTMINITNPGTYRFYWRNQVGNGGPLTEHNDTWLRFPDADDFFGANPSDINDRVYPKGVGKTPVVNGGSADGWLKVYYNNSATWDWLAATSDHQEYYVYVIFNSPGTYTMEISARASYHKIDRISMQHITLATEADATNLSTPLSSTTGGCTASNLDAIDDFSSLNISGYVPAYKDITRDAIAVNSVDYPDQWAAAEMTYSGNSGTYDLTLNTLAEEDGECSYQMFVNGVQLPGTFTNPVIHGTGLPDYTPASNTWSDVDIQTGDVIRVAFNNTTNGHIPEGAGTAYARGRWTSIDISCPTTAPDVIAKTDTFPQSGNGTEPNGTIGTTPSGVAVSGEIRRWHKITLTCDGPSTSETANPNPFTDYRFNTTFTHIPSGKNVVVPGYYSACDDPTGGCTSGNKWKVHFTPDRMGQWTYTLDFVSGSNIAVSTGSGASAGFFDGASGDFTVGESDKMGRDHRSREHGVLAYVGEHYLRYTATGENDPNGKWFVKAGADSPENMLAYDDFDGTPNLVHDKGGRKSWAPHAGDYDAGDASAYTWNGGTDGTEILGVVKYLHDKGVNAFSFLTLSLGGDDENVFPYLLNVSQADFESAGLQGDNTMFNKADHDRFDVSKLAQWEKVFEYGDKKGMFMHFKTMEQENCLFMDGATLGNDRKLYYRELIARFGHHLALNWNISEEVRLSPAVIADIAEFIEDTDPYDHHIVVHTFPSQKNLKYGSLTGTQSVLTGASLQTDAADFHEIQSDILEWINASAASGRKWAIAVDEPGDPNEAIRVDDNYIAESGAQAGNDKLVREKVVWNTYFSGGWGFEYYYGSRTITPQNDLKADNHRSRDQKYTEAAIALKFIQDHLMPMLIQMSNMDNLTAATDDIVFGVDGTVYAVYMPNGGTTSISLATDRNWFVQWFNPRTGGNLTSPVSITTTLTAPDNTNDWVALICVEPPCDAPNLGQDKSLCGVSSVLLDATINNVGRTITWKKDGVVLPGDTTQYLTVTQPGTYEVITDEDGCVNSDEVDVLNTLPTIDLGASQELCNPATIMLDAGISGAGYSYTWTKDAQPIGGNSQTLQVIEAGTYEVTVSVSGCASSSDNVTITSSLLDVSGDIICSPGSASLSVNETGNFDWYDQETGGSALNNGTTYNPTVSSTTTYYVEDASGFSALVGHAFPENGANGWGNTNWQYRNVFDVIVPLTIDSISVWSVDASSVTVSILASDLTTVVDTKTFGGINGGTTENRLATGFSLSPGTYYLDFTGTNGKLRMANNGDPNISYPYTVPGVISITGADPSWVSNQPWYMHGFNWRVSSGNSCARTPVRAVVDPSDPSCVISSTSGVENGSLEIYPNPTGGTVHFSEEIEYKLMDLLGKTVLQGNSTQIDLSGLTSGTYILTSVYGEKRIIRK